MTERQTSNRPEIQLHSYSRPENVSNDEKQFNDLQLWLIVTISKFGCFDPIQILKWRFSLDTICTDRIFKSIQEKRLVLINICMIPILWESPYFKLKMSSIFLNEHGHSRVSMEGFVWWFTAYLGNVVHRQPLSSNYIFYTRRSDRRRFFQLRSFSRQFTVMKVSWSAAWIRP